MGLQQKLAEIDSDMLSRVPARHSTFPISSSILAVVRNALFAPDEDDTTFEAPAERNCKISMLNQANQRQESAMPSSPMILSLHSAVHYVGNEHAVMCTVAHQSIHRASIPEPEPALEPELKFEQEIGDFEASVIRMRQSTLRGGRWKLTRSPSSIMDEDTEESIASHVSTRQLTCNPTGSVTPPSDDDFEFKEPVPPVRRASTVPSPPMSEPEVTGLLPKTQERTPPPSHNLSSGPNLRKTISCPPTRRLLSTKPILFKGVGRYLTKQYSSEHLLSPEEITGRMDTFPLADELMNSTVLPSSPSIRAKEPPILVRIAATNTDEIFNAGSYRNPFLAVPEVDETSPRTVAFSLNIQQQTIAPELRDPTLRKQLTQLEQIKLPKLASSYTLHTSPMDEDVGDIT